MLCTNIRSLNYKGYNLDHILEEIDELIVKFPKSMHLCDIVWLTFR